MTKTTLVHLSDLHIGQSSETNRRAEEVVARVAIAYTGATVVVTGDVTDSSTRAQLRRARDLLDTLAATNPVLVVPGNHDYCWLGVELRPGSWEDWVDFLGCPLGWSSAGRRWMEPPHAPGGVQGLGVWLDADMAYFGIDSGDPQDETHTSRGWVSERLAAQLGAALKQHAGKTRVVLVHHHPFDRGFFMALDGSRRFMRAVEGNCEVLLFGHRHQFGIWTDQRSIPLVVASHKCTGAISRDCLAIGVIDVVNPGSPDVVLRHRLDVWHTPSPLGRLTVAVGRAPAGGGRG